MVESQSLGFVLAPENSDFEENSPKPEAPPFKVPVRPDYDKKYPKRVTLQTSSSELAIISNRKWSPKLGKVSKHRLKSVRSKNLAKSKENNSFTASLPQRSAEDQPEPPPIRPSRLRQRHTFKSQPIANVTTELDGVLRKSLPTSAGNHAVFPLETQDVGRGGEAIFRSRNCVGKLHEKYSTDSLNPEKDDKKESDVLADFCKLEELAKLLAKDQESKNIAETQPEAPKAGCESFQVLISQPVAKTQENIENHPKPIGNDSESRSDFRCEKEWKQALERIQQLEISKKICDAEIKILREDLNKAGKIIFEKSQLLEKTIPKEGPPWMVPSDENIFKQNVDYFSLRTFNGQQGFTAGKLYSAKLYTPAGSSEYVKKQNKVSFRIPEVNEEFYPNNDRESNQTPRAQTNSAPPGRTYLNIRRRQMKLINPEPKYPSKKSSLQCLSPQTNQFTEKSLKARSVPLNSKLCSKKQDKLEKPVQGNTGMSSVENNPVANMEYLAIALASREGLIREIAHSVRKAKKILHFRFNMLITSDFASNDMHFLLTSHRRFLRWLNNYIQYSTNLVNRFDDKYMNSRRFFLPATMELESEMLKGIFIPVPDHGDECSPSPEFVEKSAQTNLLSSLSTIHVISTNAAAQTLKKEHLTQDKSIQVQTIISKALTNFQQQFFNEIKPSAQVTDKSTLAIPLQPKLAEKSIQTNSIANKVDQTKLPVPYLSAEKSAQTKLPPEFFHQSNQTPPSLISKKLRTTGVQSQTLNLPLQVQPSVNNVLACSVQTLSPPLLCNVMTQATINMVSMKTPSKTSKAVDIFNSKKTKNSYYSPEKNHFLNNSSKSIQVSLENESENLKPALSMRNVAFQHFQCQSPPLPLHSSTAPASAKFDVVNQPTSVQIESKVKNKPRISLNLQNLTSEQKLGTRSSPGLDPAAPKPVIESDTSKKRMPSTAANYILQAEDPPEQPENVYPMEELWSIPTAATSSIFSESLGLFPEKNLPVGSKNKPNFEDRGLNIYEPSESNSSFKTFDANAKENKEDYEDDLDGGFQLFKLGLPRKVPVRRSPLNLVSEFHEETAERFYNHRGNAHLRVLDEDKLMFPETGYLGDVGRPTKTNNNVSGGAVSSTIEDLTNFFEETVAKYKKKKSDENLEDLPKFKSAAEVVLDILSEGQDGLYQIQSDESLLKKDSELDVVIEGSLSERFSGILEDDSEIFQIDPEYEAMFELAVKEIPNVDEEFEKILMNQFPVPSSIKKKIPDIAVEQEGDRSGDAKSDDNLFPKIEISKRRCTGFEGDVLEKPRSRASRLRVRVGVGSAHKKPSKMKTVIRPATPGIAEERIPIQLKSKLLPSSGASPGEVTKPKERKSLIPVKEKPPIPSCEKCPILAQSSVKRIAKIPTQPQSGIGIKSKTTTGTIKDGSVMKRVTSFENPVVSSQTQRKSFSRICPCRKTKPGVGLSR